MGTGTTSFRLLVVADTLAGGLGAAARSHAQWFSGRGWDVELAAPADTSVQAPDGVVQRQVSLPVTARRGRALVTASAAIRGVERAFRPDVVHCHGARSFAATLLAGGRRPFVTLHGVLPGGSDPAGYRFVRRAGIVFCGRLAAGALAVFPDLPPGWHFFPHASPRLATLEQVGPMPGHDPVFVCLGSLEDRKHPERFIEVMAALRRAGLAARGILAGSGPLEPALRQQVAATGATVDFAGQVEEVGPLLEQAWAVVLLSDSEGVPFVLQEAMWSGRPVVCSSLPGTRWLLGDPPLGGVVVDTPGEVFQALSRLRDKHEAERAGRMAAARIRALLSTDDPWPAVEQMYRSRLGR